MTKLFPLQVELESRRVEKRNDPIERGRSYSLGGVARTLVYYEYVTKIFACGI